MARAEGLAEASSVRKEASVHDNELPLSLEAFRGFQRLIYDKAGITLSDAKQQLVAGRLAKRVRELALPDYGAYYQYIVNGEGRIHGELQRCIDLLTTNETYFFREGRHFEFLVQEVLSQHPRGRPLRLWSAASSTGEEAYTLAMVLADSLGLDEPWEIFATDISTRVLDQAQDAVYCEERARLVPDALRQRYLMKGTRSQAGRVRVVPELCQRVQFVHYNLVSSPLPSRQFHIIFCRNVLIYFDQPTKQQVVERLCSGLVEDGHLITGHSESLHGLVPALRSVMPSIYRKQRTSP